jgi:hypothetical protein
MSSPNIPNKPNVLKIDFSCENDFGRPFKVYGCDVTGNSASILINGGGPQWLEFDRKITDVYVVVPGGGYWPLAFHGVGNSVSGVIPRMPGGPTGWWHTLHGVRRFSSQRGQGIRIGVIDEALPEQEVDSPLADIANLGGIGWSTDPGRAFLPKNVDDSIACAHAVSVCSLIAARAGTPGGHFEGIAPGAEVLFCAAGSESSHRLDPRRLADAISHLSVEQKCDIITFSAGDLKDRIPAVRDAMGEALRNGTLCFAAAGNCGGLPRYPAKYRHCLSVGALGSMTGAPSGTWDAEEIPQGGAVQPGGTFLWKDSARGPGVNFLGAGVSVLLTDPQGRCRSATGTSYAAPIVAATAAVILSKDLKYMDLKRQGRDRDRVKYGVRRLQGLCASYFPGNATCGVLRAV